MTQRSRRTTRYMGAYTTAQLDAAAVRQRRHDAATDRLLGLVDANLSAAEQNYYRALAPRLSAEQLTNLYDDLAAKVDAAR